MEEELQAMLWVCEEEAFHLLLVKVMNGHQERQMGMPCLSRKNNSRAVTCAASYTISTGKFRMENERYTYFEKYQTSLKARGVNAGRSPNSSSTSLGHVFTIADMDESVSEVAPFNRIDCKGRNLFVTSNIPASVILEQPVISSSCKLIAVSARATKVLFDNCGTPQRAIVSM